MAIDIEHLATRSSTGRFRLLAGPTPLQRLARIEDALGTGPLWVKRDDLTGFGVSGNKARTLEYLIGDARGERAEVFVAGGRPGSNFCAAAALAARVGGLDCHLVMAELGAEPSPNVALAMAMGAHIIDVAEHPELASLDLDQAIESYAGSLRTSGRRVYAVPRGGATGVGALGYADAVAEFTGQLRDADLEPTAVVVAVGTGGTVAGLLTGRSEMGGGWALHGVCVSQPAAQLAARITRISADCADLRGTRVTNVMSLTDAPGAHGVLTQAQADLADLALAEEGLLLDSTYTAKSFERAVAIARVATRPSVFWHTGGTLAALERLR